MEGGAPRSTDAMDGPDSPVLREVRRVLRDASPGCRRRRHRHGWPPTPRALTTGMVGGATGHAQRAAGVGEIVLHVDDDERRPWRELVHASDASTALPSTIPIELHRLATVPATSASGALRGSWATLSGACTSTNSSSNSPISIQAETSEWIESLDQVVEDEGETRARFLLFKLLKRARQLQVGPAAADQHPLHQHDQPRAGALLPGRRGDRAAHPAAHPLERRGDGPARQHAASRASAATSPRTPRRRRLYEVGFNHFFRGKDGDGPGDQVFYQGHAAPGIYARAFLEGRLSEDQLDHFRRETPPQDGLSSYPHPRLMPDFWEFPTVSMGLGPISAIYQARFNRYLENRGLLDTSKSRVWAFLGDGETDEPEALGALHVAAREGLDNLTFVVNCNLQRLDGPVRGNGKIIQELEAVFRGSGWNVIKVVWGREWDELLAQRRRRRRSSRR